MSNLTILDLPANNLTGSIPPELGQLSNLTFLQLCCNQLTGNIPIELGDLTQLNFLDLHSNQLSGCYDVELMIFCNQLSSPDFNANERISDGNNFDATWEDFCNSNGELGNCQLSNQVWPGDFDNNGTVEINDLLYWGLAYNCLLYTSPSPRDS